MDQNQSEEKKPEPKLGNHDDGSELIRIGPSVTCGKGEHYFTYKSSQEIICTKCPIGYPINGFIEIRDGHVYKEGVFLI